MLKSAAKWQLLILLTLATPALAQLQNGQIGSGPKPPVGLTPSPASPLSNSAMQNQPAAHPGAAGAGRSIAAPASTVGNTPSALQTGPTNGSGYSATGSTVNGNINNTTVGNRSAGQPMGSGSQTSTSRATQTNGTGKN